MDYVQDDDLEKQPPGSHKIDSKSSQVKTKSSEFSDESSNDQKIVYKFAEILEAISKPPVLLTLFLLMIVIFMSYESGN